MEKLNIKKNDKILILSPHPDDESIGCGGLLINHARQCDVLILTDGCHGGLPGDTCEKTKFIRKNECLKAMKFLQVHNVYFKDIEDSLLKINYIEFSNYNFDKYTKIFCPNDMDNHEDHACVLNFLQKTGYSKEIYLYEVWSTLPQPSHYIDISDNFLKKKQLIKFYKSQIKQLDYSEKILGLNKYRGMQVYPAITYAEIFKKI